MKSIKGIVLGFVALAASLLVCTKASAYYDTYDTTSENYVGFAIQLSKGEATTPFVVYTYVAVYDQYYNFIGDYGIDAVIDGSTADYYTWGEGVNIDYLYAGGNGISLQGNIPLPGWGHYHVEVYQEIYPTGNYYAQYEDNWYEDTTSHFQRTNFGRAAIQIDIGPGT